MGGFKKIPLLAFLLLLLVSPLGLRADEGGWWIQGGLLRHRLSLREGYGGFLRQRLGAAVVDLEGHALQLGRRIGAPWGLGLEMASLSGPLDYTDLNGFPRRDGIRLRYWQGLVRHRLGSLGRISAGLGESVITRRLIGFQNAMISAQNLPANSGRADAVTRAPVALLEPAMLLRFGDLGLVVGLRVMVSRHTIGLDDKRPALDRKQNPQASEFAVSSPGWALWLAVEP